MECPKHRYLNHLSIMDENLSMIHPQAKFLSIYEPGKLKNFLTPITQHGDAC